MGELAYVEHGWMDVWVSRSLKGRRVCERMDSGMDDMLGVDGRWMDTLFLRVSWYLGCNIRMVCFEASRCK